jgi:formyltetrahydrofolate-dependent phosphoribosylglycinamide formyltransferase
MGSQPDRSASRTDKLRVGVLLSGSGRTLQNLLDLAASGELPIRIEIVIASRPDAYGLERAKAAGVPTCVVERRGTSTDAFSARITEALVAARVELVCLAGFLSLWHVPPAFIGKVMNIHPALLPRFGGKGFHGRHVHRAVLAAGCEESGCTVHFADNEYDHGPIIVQRTVPVLDDDTEETLAARVFAEELIAFPDAIRWFAENRLRIEGNRVRVLPPL